MATHSSILAWRIPWTEEPGGLQSMGLQRIGHDWAINTNVSWSKLLGRFWLVVLFFSHYRMWILPLAFLLMVLLTQLPISHRTEREPFGLIFVLYIICFILKGRSLFWFLDFWNVSDMLKIISVGTSGVHFQKIRQARLHVCFWGYSRMLFEIFSGFVLESTTYSPHLFMFVCL